MTNEEIIESDTGENNYSIEQLLDLARQDERENMTEEKVKEYLGGLGGKEAALIVLNYLIRGGITDDDLRGLRLQWIKDEREKMQGVEVWVSWDENGFEYPIVTIKQPIQNTFTNGEVYHTGIGQNFSLKKEDAEKLGIQKGQCKKFRIVEVI